MNASVDAYDGDYQCPEHEEEFHQYVATVPTRKSYKFLISSVSVNRNLEHGPQRDNGQLSPDSKVDGREKYPTK